MNNHNYIERTYRKFDNVLDLYAARIFKTVDRAAAVYGMETPEHLRKVPDASLLTEISAGTDWGKEYSNLWLVTEYTVPAELAGSTVKTVLLFRLPSR